MAGPPTDAERALFEMLDEIGQRMYSTSLPRVQQASEALAEALEYVVDLEASEAYVTVPHFWALYVHEGRPTGFEVRRPGKKALVWFADPRDDPRTRDGYPVRETDIKTLSVEDYNNGLIENAKRRAAGGTPFMYVAKRWPYPTPADKFFTEPLANIGSEVPAIVQDKMQNFFKALADSVREPPQTARIKLR